MKYVNLPARSWATAKRLLPATPAALVAVIPSTLACPVCWPIIAALLSAVGLGHALVGPYAPYVMIGLLAIAVLPLAVRAARGGGLLAPVVGVVASALVVVGRFAIASDWMTYAGAVLLMVAPFVRKRGSERACGPSCSTACHFAPPAPAIACNLDAAGLGRRQGLLLALVGRATQRREVPDGYSFGFAPGSLSLAALVEVIEPERRCCPFLRFVVTAEPDDGPVWLEMSGPAATKDFLRGLLNLA